MKLKLSGKREHDNYCLMWFLKCQKNKKKILTKKDWIHVTNSAPVWKKKIPEIGNLSHKAEI